MAGEVQGEDGVADDVAGLGRSFMSMLVDMTSVVSVDALAKLLLGYSVDVALLNDRID